MEVFQLPEVRAALLAMLGGLALLYIAAQSLAGPIFQGLGASPWRRAFWHGAPVAAAAFMAVLLGQRQMALGILTGCSVAVLSLAPGVSRLMTSHAESEGTDSRCALLLAPALIFWLIGFRAEIDWLSAIFLGIQGALLLSIWREPYPTRRYSFFASIIFILSVALAAVAAVLAIHGAVHLQAYLSTPTPIIFASGIVAPILALPVLGESVRLTEENRAGEARAIQAAMAMIHLTILIPLCVLLSYLMPHFNSMPAGPMPFPLSVWRVDSAVLVILSIWLLAAPGLPRWLGKVEGMVLIVIFGAYLISLANVDLFIK